MSYLLDTNAWSSYLNYPSSPIRQRIARLHSSEIAFCSVVKAELLYGVYKSSKRDDNLASLVDIFKPFRSYVFDDAAALIYGQIRAELASRGTPIGPNDFLIAAIALANRLTLVTHNVSEFSKVPGLSVEDWEA